jgi:hypothetical protein
MQDKTQLLQQFDEARGKMRATLAGIDAHMEIYPGWTIKELLAHLAGWDDATIAALKAFTSGGAPPVPAARGLDVYNAETVAERATLDYEHIVKEWEWVREQLLVLLDEMPSENLEMKIVTPWGRSTTVARLVAIMAEHEEEHAADVHARRVNPGQSLPTHV